MVQENKTKGAASSKKAIKRAYKNGRILDWHKSVALDKQVFNLTLSVLGREKFRKVLARWPKETRESLRSKLRANFSEDFYDDGVNDQARQRYAWFFGNLAQAFFANKSGKVVYDSKAGARDFARLKLKHFKEKDFKNLEKSEKNIKILARFLPPADIPEAAFGLEREIKKEVTNRANKIDNEALLNRLLYSDLWQLEKRDFPKEFKKALKKKNWVKTNKEIADSVDLREKKAPKLAQFIKGVVEKEISLEEGSFNNALRGNFPNLEEQEIKKLALQITKKRFWPLREWLSGTEKLIKDLGGELPKEGPKGWQETKLNEAESEPKAPSDSRKKKKREESKKAFKPPQNLPGQESTEAQKKTADEPAGSIKTDKKTKKAGEAKDKKQARLVKKPIKELQNEFPQVKDQPLTSDPIELQDMGEDVRPTVKNWLKDYRFRMGAGYHDNMQRRSYLFRTKNGEKLDKTERKIISELLSSADEREPLPFDPEIKKIVINELVSRKEKPPKKKAQRKKKRTESSPKSEKSTSKEESSLLGKDKKDVPSGFEKIKEEEKAKKKGEKKNDSQKTNSTEAGEKPEPDPNGKTVDLSK